MDFQKTQYCFTAWLREPLQNPPPAGVKPERMQVYRELIFNNIESLMANSFPVIKSLLPPVSWNNLIEDFFAHHQSKTPYFSEIAEEFLDFLQHERKAGPKDPPFLLELAHYEWVELALAIAEPLSQPAQAIPEGDSLLHPIQLSELAWPLAYHFPVHQIGPETDWHTAPANPSFLLVYRNADDEVKFMEISKVTFRWLEIVRESGPCPAMTSFLSIAEELNQPQPDSILAFGKELLQQMAEKGIICFNTEAATP